MDEVFYFLHFTGDDGIRDLTAIGESTKPIIVEFDTRASQYNPGNRTEVSEHGDFWSDTWLNVVEPDQNEHDFCRLL